MVNPVAVQRIVSFAPDGRQSTTAAPSSGKNTINVSTQ